MVVSVSFVLPVLLAGDVRRLAAVVVAVVPGTLVPTAAMAESVVQL